MAWGGLTWAAYSISLWEGEIGINSEGGYLKDEASEMKDAALKLLLYMTVLYSLSFRLLLSFTFMSSFSKNLVPPGHDFDNGL